MPEVSRPWTDYYKAAEAMMLHRHYDKAEPLLKFGIVRARDSGEPQGVDSCLDDLAELYRLEKNFPEAARALEMLIKERIELWWPDHPYVLQARRRLADLYLYNNQGTRDELIAVLKQVVADDEHIFGPEDRQTGQDLDTLAYSLFTAGNAQAAQPIYKRVLDIREKTLPKTNVKIAETYYQLVVCYRVAGDLKGAETTSNKAISHPSALAQQCMRGRLYGQLGNTLHELKRSKESEHALQQAASLMSGCLGHEDELFQALLVLANVYAERNNYSRAIETARSSIMACKQGSDNFPSEAKHYASEIAHIESLIKQWTVASDKSTAKTQVGNDAN